MKTIDVDLSRNESIDFSSMTGDVISRIQQAAELAIADVVQEQIGDMQMDYAMSGYSGDRRISVSADAIPDGWRITASGDALGFIEFGTGEQADNGKPSYMESVDYPIYPGSFSETEGTGEFARSSASPRYWHHKGKREYGGPGIHAFEYATEQIAEKLPGKVKEYLK